MGLTFEDAYVASAILLKRGDITFTDCVWRNHVQSAGIVLMWYRPPTGLSRRKLLPAEIHHSDPFEVGKQHFMSRKGLEDWMRTAAREAENADIHSRQLQAPFTMEVTFQHCLFMANANGSTDSSMRGIVTIETPFIPTVFRDTRFVRNTYYGSDGNQNGYAIQSRGSPLEVHNCCFEGNNFNGFGPVQVFAGAPFESSSNYISPDDLLFCSFAALSDITPDTIVGVECVDSDFLACYGTIPPTASPTQSTSLSFVPTAEPSATPSTSPTISPSLSFPPTAEPSATPSLSPTLSPSVSFRPTVEPSAIPSHSPTLSPSLSFVPTAEPSAIPSQSFVPTVEPSASPSQSRVPTVGPTNEPSAMPSQSFVPTVPPTVEPSASPSQSILPSILPTIEPSVSALPSQSLVPTLPSTVESSALPSQFRVPTAAPSEPAPTAATRTTTDTPRPSTSAAANKGYAVTIGEVFGGFVLTWFLV